MHAVTDRRAITWDAGWWGSVTVRSFRGGDLTQMRRTEFADGSGDLLDAVICAAQAAWGWKRRSANFGLPLDAPAGEGWIVTAG